MKDHSKIPHIHGSVNLKSELSLEQVGEIISNKILSGVLLEGKEKRIYDEVPAIFNGSLGFSFILQGYSGLNHTIGFIFSIVPNFSVRGAEKYDINVDSYLIALFKEKLKNISEIKIVEDSEDQV